MAAAAKILPLGLLHMRLFQLWVKRAETREIKITSHPEVVVQIWQRFGKADVDLFAAKESTHCPYGSPSYLHLAWPRLCLIAFAPDCSAPWSSSQSLSGQSSPFASWSILASPVFFLLNISPKRLSVEDSDYKGPFLQVLGTVLVWDCSGVPAHRFQSLNWGWDHSEY